MNGHWDRRVHQLLMMVRRLLPANVRPHARGALFDWLDLRWQRPSGIGLQVRTYGDWVIFNEIFVDGEYDAAIVAALSGHREGPPLRVLDLGANVGFFTLRLADLARARGVAAPPLAVTAVEAHPDRLGELRRRIADNDLCSQVTVVEGLAGRRAGPGVLWEDSIVHRPEHPQIAAAFVDLEASVPADGNIDLIKCDIEGAEQLVIENYPALLRRTRRAIFELHHDLCDTDACIRNLRDLGFAHETTLRSKPDCSIHHVWR